ncbi:MAG TPA: YggT family protein [Acidimicrobiales bacterium]
MDDPTVQEYERRAEEYQHSPLVALLKVARVVVWLVYAFAIVTGVLLTTAFFLHLAGANPEASFVEWVYRSTDRAMRPFRGIFAPQDVGGSSVLDFSYLIAAIVYFVIALLVDGVHRWLTGKLRRQEREAGRARAQADMAAQRTVDRQYADERSAQQAAAQQYAAQQAAAQQYAIARAAAQEALTQQRPPAGPARPEPPSSAF